VRAGIDILVVGCLLALWMAAARILQVNPASLEGRLILPIRMLMLLGVATLLLRRNRESWREVGLRRPRGFWRTLGLALVAYLASYALVLPIGYALVRYTHLPLRGATMFVNVHGGLGEYLFWIVPIVWGTAAFGEEMLFRGFFFTRFMRLFPKGPVGLVLALSLQSLLFGAIHISYGLAPAVLAGALGLVLASVYLISGRNLWAGIILHGLIDTTSFTTVFLRPLLG
jgi:uncharacterized protein